MALNVIKKMNFKLYDTIKIVEILNPEKMLKSEFNLVAPKADDIAAIVEIYTSPTIGYELECSNCDGITQWLVTFGPEDIIMELV